MPNRLSWPGIILSKIVHHLISLRADQRGTIAVIMGFLLPVLIGGLGVGYEISSWYMRTRAMQNAADAAAIAAASNGSSSYGVEAKAVTAKYGFVDGSKNVTVTPDVSNALCPAGLNISPPQQCYKVTITSLVPLYLAEVVGYSGDATVNGTKEKTLSSAAIAVQPLINQPICLLGLDPKNQAIRTNGAPNSDFSGCTVMSDSGATCNGSNLKAFMGIAVGTNGGGAGCGNIQLSDQQPMPDPFSQFASNIPSNLGCNKSWPQEKKKGGVMSGGTVWNGAPSISNNKIVACGDVRLAADVTINAPAGTVLYIENGMLDLNNHTLTTTGLTIVFTGKNTDPGAVNYGHYPTDSSGNVNSVLDMRAPTTGPFPGIAIYQDPALTTGDLGLTYSGNNPEWKISGFVYTPNTSVTLSGAIDKATNGAQCFAMVGKDVTINGTGSIYAQTPDASACKAAGYQMPTTKILGRGQLVY